MSNLPLKKLLYDYLNDFNKHDSENSSNVTEALKNFSAEIDDDELIAWWKEQDITWIASLQSYKTYARRSN